MNIITEHIGAWLATVMVAFMTIFSDKILQRIRFSLNRADLRVKYFEELSIDLSTYLFFAGIFHERYEKGWADDPEDLAAIGGEINSAITTLRKKEYVYRSWVRKYWGDKAAAQLADVLKALNHVEDAIHTFNDPGEETKKASVLGQNLDVLRMKVEGWLSQHM